VAAAREASPGGVDALFDCVGGETFRRGFEAVRDEGTVVTIAAFGEETPETRGISSHAFSAKAERRKLERLSEMIDAGDVRVEITGTLPLEEAARAHEQVETGHTRGKLVLEVS
jgi:NADPH:quinone reductase-like Zn-dependent oxidoreductase